MNKAHLGDTYTHKLTLRLTDGQYEFVKEYATSCGVTPSEYVRMFINAGLTQAKKLEEEAKKEAKKSRKR